MGSVQRSKSTSDVTQVQQTDSSATSVMMKRSKSEGDLAKVGGSGSSVEQRGSLVSTSEDIIGTKSGHTESSKKIQQLLVGSEQQQQKVDARQGLIAFMAQMDPGRDKVNMLQSLIEQPMSLNGAPPEAVKAMAQKMKSEMVDSFVTKLPINDTHAMDEFVKDFKAGTGNFFGTSFNPEMKKVNAALSELQKVIKNNPGDSEVAVLARFEALEKLQAAAKNFCEKCPNSSKISMVERLTQRVGDIVPPQGLAVSKASAALADLALTSFKIGEPSSEAPRDKATINRVLNQPGALAILDTYLKGENGSENTQFLIKAKVVLSERPPDMVKLKALVTSYVETPPVDIDDYAPGGPKHGQKMPVATEINLKAENKKAIMDAFNANPQSRDNLIKAFGGAIEEIAALVGNDNLPRLMRDTTFGPQMTKQMVEFSKTH
jgi:hypothetical protein